MIDKEQFNKFLDQGHDYIPLQKKLDIKKEHPLSLFKKVSHLLAFSEINRETTKMFIIRFPKKIPSIPQTSDTKRR